MVNVNFRMDEKLKNDFESVCNDMGVTLTTAFTIFAKRVCMEKAIPFEVSADPFLSESNMKHLKRGIAELNAGLGKEHDLIEE